MDKRTSDIVSFLNKDLIRNSNIINFIEENKITYLNKIGEAVIVKGISDREWVYFSSKNENGFRDLLNEINVQDINFAVLEDWMLPILKENFYFEIELSVIKYILPEKVTMPEKTGTVSRLLIEHADYIYENYEYKDFTNVEYIRNRIVKGISCGIFIGNKLVAWSITHDDGAIGMLQVLPEYRGKGLAKEITSFMINEIRKRNKIPFVQIEKRNLPSNRLASGIVFIKDRRVHWIKKQL
jgi:GNAT superfamily N-acetyltransferase